MMHINFSMIRPVAIVETLKVSLVYQNHRLPRQINQLSEKQARVARRLLRREERSSQ
jgi:hypothetical protein